MESVTMSKKELQKLEVVQLVEKGVLTQGKAAQEVGVSRRQIIRLCQRYRKQGPPGLVHRSRGYRVNV